MRLLRLEADGNFSLVEYVGSHIPRYAILSHTWGADYDEVTFTDMKEGTSKNKAGYRKLTFCGNQAAKDDLQYFWVDTCCIDKSSSAELSEAINSMFRWYHNAAKCYVYLSDISINDSSSQITWNLAFQQSRWFSRGWTLQELIAPTSVEFFSLEGELLGDKGSMVQEIHEITGISIYALQGGPLTQFSVHERMLWAERRETKREEDAAYSLLGIFNIHMPLIYGEGRENAFVRLRREIDYTSNIEALFQRNQGILLDTQRLVLQQHDIMRTTSTTASRHFRAITSIAMPLLITIGIFSIPANIFRFHRSPTTFFFFTILMQIFFSISVHVISLVPRRTPSTPNQDNLELQQLTSSP